jgi:hypothetical protein
VVLDGLAGQEELGRQMDIAVTPLAARPSKVADAG